MRTEDQIVQFLCTSKAKSQKDLYAILHYCRTQGIDLEDLQYKNLSVLCADHGRKIKYEEFVTWMEEAFPKIREVVKLSNGCVGIITKIELPQFTFGVLVDEKGRLYANETMTLQQPFKFATDVERAFLQRSINEQGLSWRMKDHTLVEKKYKPADNDFVKISQAGYLKGIGIFKEITEEGLIVLYCYKYCNGGVVELSLNTHVSNILDLQIDICSSKKREELIADLDKAGIHWNGYVKRIEPKKFRVAPGQRYFYCDTFGSVRMKIDERASGDDKRYSCGNYFRNQKSCVNFIKSIKLLKSVRVETGETYFYCDTFGHMGSKKDNRTSADNKRYNLGNYFKDQLSCESFIEDITSLRNIEISGTFEKLKELFPRTLSAF